MKQILVSPLEAPKSVIVHRIEVPQTRRLRTDVSGTFNIAQWVTIIITAVVLMVITTALFPTFLDSLTDFDNATTNPLAPVLVVVVPILLIAGLILLFVFAFMPGSLGRGGGGGRKGRK